MMGHVAMVVGGTTWLEGHLKKIGENHGAPFPRFLYGGILIHLDNRLW